MKFKQLFQQFLQWKLTELELKEILLRATQCSDKFTYTLIQTVNGGWFLSENHNVIGLGTRAHSMGQVLRAGEVISMSNFIRRPMVLTQDAKPSGY